MLIVFDNMHDGSRVWVYTAERDLNEEESRIANDLGYDFVTQWTAHSRDLTAGFTVIENRFIVLSVDETMQGASGCSIDSSVNFVRSLEDKLGISMLNGGKVAVQIEGSIALLTTTEIKKLAAEGNFGVDNIMYDHLVTNLGDLRNHFKKRSGDSWLKGFIPQAETA